MIFTEDDKNEKPLFIIEENPGTTEGQDEGEVPVITIETDNITIETDNDSPKPSRRTPWVVAAAIATVLLCIACGYMFYRTYMDINMPVSVTSEQNIEKLKASDYINASYSPDYKYSTQTPEVVMTSDSILGVALNFYEIRGLKAEIEFSEPDTADTDVFLYSRCADQTSYDPETNHYIGSLVAEGEDIESDASRLGYCAMANNNIVIGVARDEKVKDYVQKQGGSFFRQFVLVSNGELPSHFELHGKVERRGLGRIGDTLYYIETRHKETMWDFADALREYGFIDAIYITGGNDCSFYRTADGTVHTIGDSTKCESRHKGNNIVPWIVFRGK